MLIAASHVIKWESTKQVFPTLCTLFILIAPFHPHLLPSATLFVHPAHRPFPAPFACAALRVMLTSWDLKTAAILLRKQECVLTSSRRYWLTADSVDDLCLMNSRCTAGAKHARTVGCKCGGVWRLDVVDQVCDWALARICGCLEDEAQQCDLRKHHEQ